MLRLNFSRRKESIIFEINHCVVRQFHGSNTHSYPGFKIQRIYSSLVNSERSLQEVNADEILVTFGCHFQEHKDQFPYVVYKVSASTVELRDRCETLYN